MISLVVINYRSADLAIEAVRSARAATASPLQTIIVDNSCDEREAGRLRGHSDHLIVSDRNRGYGGAANDARRMCEGDVLIIANPDVIFGAAAIDKLAAELKGGVAAAGPALYWDDAFSWLLPPSDLVTTREKFDEAIASRSMVWARARDRRRTRRRIHFWSLRETTPMRAISGAVMAFRTADFDEAGGFDERFPLYFEENDLLRRLSARGKGIVYVPAAQCRHVYNQSAGSERARAAELYAYSEAAYLEKWSGKSIAKVLKAVERPARAAAARRADGPIDVPFENVIVEATPLGSFATAAGHRPVGRTVDIPAEVWEAYRSDVLYVRVVEATTGRPLANYVRYRS